MKAVIDVITLVNDKINGCVWGWPALILLGFVGVLMTFVTKFFQVSHWRHWWKNTLGAIFKDKNVTGHTKDKTISQFQSLCTALAATVGTGNIVGVAGAIATGGPGAVFWMWVIAFFGMMTNYSENVLGILFRRKGQDGEWHGGAMYYLRDGLGAKKNCKQIGAILAWLFSLFCLLASFGIGNMSQVNSMVENVNSAFGIPKIAVGIFLVVAVGIVIIGGLKRVASITEKLVPFMVVVYFIGAIIIIILHASQIPAIFSAIFRCAFSVKAVAGGGVGAGIALAMKMGFKRGVFSNEAGLGSSVMVHSSSNVKEPVRQGMWGIFEVFADTIIVCTLTALVILGSGAVDLKDGSNALYTDENGQYEQAVDEETGDLVVDDAGNPVYLTVIDKNGGSASLMAYSFDDVFGVVGKGFIALAILLFAYSTVLGWSHYGATACQYLFGDKLVLPYRIVFVIIVLLGSLMEAKLAWDISDTFNGLMMLPNLIGVLVLSPLVAKATKNYINRHMHNSDEKPMLSMFDDIQKTQEKALAEEGDE